MFYIQKDVHKFYTAFCLAYFIIKDNLINCILSSHFLSFILNLLFATWNVAVLLDIDLKFILDFLFQNLLWFWTI